MADTTKSDNTNWTITALVGLAGVAVGNLIGSPGGEDPVAKAIAGLETKVEALGAMSDDIAGLGSKVDTVGAASADAGAQVAALMQELEGVKAQIGGLEGQVGGLEGQVGGLEGKVDETASFVTAFGASLGMIGEKLTDMRGEIGALSGAHNAVHGGEQVAVAPAEAEAAEPEVSDAERLAAEIGPDGLVLGVGQTATVNETSVFMSKIGEGSVWVAVGRERMQFGGNLGALSLGNGCSLMLAGVADSKAYIKPDCG